MQFKDIPGQDKIKKRLIRSVIENRVSHAQLFLGPEGSGKLALALAYAQYINCKHRTPEDSCGTCPTCNKFSKVIHPDLHFLYPVNKTKEIDEKNVTSKDFILPWREFLIENNFYISLPDWYEKIGIEKKQGFIGKYDSDIVNHTLAYKAYEADYKILIIWMAEKLHHVAANKLLKNLEEPPEKTLFILISENQEQLISTILSRSQLIKFPRFDDDAVLKAIRERSSTDENIMQSIVRRSEGNMRLALSMAGMGLQDTASDEEREHFVLMREWMRKIYVYASKGKEFDVLQEINGSIFSDGSREKQKEFLGYCLKIMQLCMHYNIGNSHLVRYGGEELEFISKFSAYIHPRNISSSEYEINRAIKHIERNANANLVITDLSLILSRLIKIPGVPNTKKA